MYQSILNFVAGNPGNTLSLHFAAGQNGRLEVSIIPEAKAGGLVPQVLVESVDVLNADFSAFLEGYLQTNQTLAERLNSIKASADALAKQAEAKAASDAAGKKKRASSVPGVVPVHAADPDDLNDDVGGETTTTSSPDGAAVATSAAAGTAQIVFDL